MRTLISLILFAASLSAQPLPALSYGSVNAGIIWNGPKALYPGYSAYFYFPSQLNQVNSLARVPVVCSATGNTCDAAGSGYTPLGTEINVEVSADTPPTGLDTISVGYRAEYAICNVIGTTFQLGHSPTCATIETFSSTGTNVSIFLPSVNISDAWITNNTGWPSGTTITWGQSSSDGGYANNILNATANGNFHVGMFYSIFMEVDIPSNASPGDYPIVITKCTTDTAAHGCAGLSDTLSFTVTVTAITVLPDSAGPTSFPAITGLSTWSGMMTDATTGGAKWCNKTTGVTNPTTMSYGTETQVWYYDGANTYATMANYLGDSAWNKCATNLSTQYLTSYVIPNRGAFSAWRVFSRGFRNTVLQDPRYIAGVQYLSGTTNSVANGSDGDAYLKEGCSFSDTHIREDAYGLETMLNVQDMGLNGELISPTAAFKLPAREKRCADVLIGFLDAYTNGTKRYGTLQNFMMGLAMHALIHWWQRTKDPRVPMIGKIVADQYWAQYNQSTMIAMWWPDPVGVYCSVASNWFVPIVAAAECGTATRSTSSDLANLFGHVFGWYWRISGDNAYRTEGDTVFANEFLCPLCINGKSYSQSMFYALNYVGWRQGWLSPEKSVE